MLYYFSLSFVVGSRRLSGYYEDINGSTSYHIICLRFTFQSLPCNISVQSSYSRE